MLSLWSEAQLEPEPTVTVTKGQSSMEVAKEMGVIDFLDLFLDENTLEDARLNSSTISNLREMKRKLQDVNPAAVPTAACVVDSYLIASFIGILGNIINGAVKGCKRADKTKFIFKLDAFKDLLPNINAIIPPRQKIVISDLLDQGCRIGIETSVSIVSFIAGFLALAVNDCALAMGKGLQEDAACGGAVALTTAGVAYLTAGAETAQAVCPPRPKKEELDINVEALDIAGGLSRRLQSPSTLEDRLDRNPVLATKVDDVKEVLVKRKARKDQARTDKLVKCGFDVAGVVGFAAAAGVFITAGTLECPLAIGDHAQATSFKMGCSLDISAVIAALTTIGGFIGLLATECPKKPDRPADNICATAAFNIVSSLGFLSGGLSDAARQCKAP
eukprot:Skav212705  [mRNA]  locus=scaffold1930:439704:441708:- [translate_table: standard]